MKKWMIYFTRFFGGFMYEDYFTVYAINRTEAEKVGQEVLNDNYLNAKLRRVEPA